MDADLKQKLLERYKRKIKYAGRQHPLIRLVRKIAGNGHDGDERLIAAEGLWAHGKLIETGMDISCMVVCPELLYSAEALEVAGKCMDKAAEIYIVSQKLFGRLSGRDRPDGLISLVRLPDWTAGSFKPGKDASIVVLDGLENPGNIGTILRTCDGAGVDAVFICNRRARLTGPKLVKASMGAIFSVPVIEFGDARQCIN